MYFFCFAELKKRREIFNKNLRTIEKLQTSERGSATYGVTQFADLTPEEFHQRMTTPGGVHKPDLSMGDVDLIDDQDVPERFDWRKKGTLTVFCCSRKYFCTPNAFLYRIHLRQS